MERELLTDIGDRRLLPSMSLHEFEAIAFVSPTTVAEVVEGRGSPAAGDLEAVAASFRGPEEINEGRETAPSKRILGCLHRYRKVLHGPLTASRIGLTCRLQAPNLSRLKRVGPVLTPYLRRDRQ